MKRNIPLSLWKTDIPEQLLKLHWQCEVSRESKTSRRFILRGIVNSLEKSFNLILEQYTLPTEIQKFVDYENICTCISRFERRKRNCFLFPYILRDCYQDVIENISITQ